MNLFIYEQRERGRGCLLEMEPRNCLPVTRTHFTVAKVLKVAQELKTEIVWCVPWIQTLQPLPFPTKVLNAALAEKFKSMLN